MVLDLVVSSWTRKGEMYKKCGGLIFLLVVADWIMTHVGMVTPGDPAAQP